MKRIVAAWVWLRAFAARVISPAYWRHGFSKSRAAEGLLSSFGTMWLAAEIATFFNPAAGDWIRGQWRWFLLIGLGWAVIKTRPRTKFSCRLANRDVIIEVRVGDMFALDGAYVIGSNTSFDTDVNTGLISKKSVQGQFTARYYNSVAHLDTDLSNALAGVVPEQTVNGKKGKAAVYRVGTTVHVETKERRAYFVAIATMSNDGVAHGSFEDLLNSLPILWEYISTRGNFDNLVVPVLGSGYSRLSQKRDEIIREIVKSFIAACSSSRPTERLTIVIPYKDCSDHDLDLDELENFVQHVCRYADFQSAGTAGVGTGIA